MKKNKSNISIIILIVVIAVTAIIFSALPQETGVLSTEVDIPAEEEVIEVPGTNPEDGSVDVG